MRPFVCLTSLLLLLLLVQLEAKDRTLIRLPEVSGYKIIKADLHSHTVFSDGRVWPDFRVGEAWINGLDALAITDHIEYQRHKDDMPKNLNRSYEIAKTPAAAVGLTLIKSAEITKSMPPGHINALYLDDIDLVDKENWKDAVKAAHNQGAFIFWNHPGWKGQQSDGISKWYKEHDELFDEGMLHGIEIVNNDEYYPEAHQWCLDKNLTILGNSDIHSTTNMQYTESPYNHRPMTWVLAKENTASAIKEALINRRTMVYFGDQIFGAQEYLKSLFNGCVTIETPTLSRKIGQQFQLSNQSDLTFTLERTSATEGISAPENVTLRPGKTVGMKVGFDKKKEFDLITLEYTVSNLKSAPDTGLPISFVININE